MSTHIITVNGLEARITIERGNSVGYPSRGITMDESGAFVAETLIRTFNGYCSAEIVEVLASDMLVTRRRIELEDVQAAVEGSGLMCMCSADEEDEN